MMNRRGWIGLTGTTTLASVTGANWLLAEQQPASSTIAKNNADVLQQAKEVVRNYHEAIENASPLNITSALAKWTSPAWKWRGMHPFHEKTGAAEVGDAFWTPFLTAMLPVSRRPDIFFAGRNELDDYQSTWVVSTGHLMGLFKQPWLGIRPTGRIVMLRYAEFNRVEGDKIVETDFFFDIPHLMMQAGQNPFPPQTAAHLVQPGPATHDGLMYAKQDPSEGEKTLALINAMISDIEESELSHHDRLAKYWDEKMIWWGPGGIGAAYTIDGYIQHHAGPFNKALSEGYKFNAHVARLAEGHFGGFFGWANLTVQNSGGFLGMTASATPADMRVVDIYREENGKLAENWVFIDLLHYLNMQGLDVLSRMESLAPGE